MSVELERAVAKEYFEYYMKDQGALPSELSYTPEDGYADGEMNTAWLFFLQGFMTSAKITEIARNAE